MGGQAAGTLTRAGLATSFVRVCRTLVLALLVVTACHRAPIHRLTKADLERARVYFYMPTKKSPIDEITRELGPPSRGFDGRYEWTADDNGTQWKLWILGDSATGSIMSLDKVSESRPSHDDVPRRYRAAP